eukprot:324159-Rhodomonas_salina.1
MDEEEDGVARRGGARTWPRTHATPGTLAGTRTFEPRRNPAVEACHHLSPGMRCSGAVEVVTQRMDGSED